MATQDNEDGVNVKQSNGIDNTDNPVVLNVSKMSNKRMRRKQSKWTLIITFLSFVLIIILITIAYLVSKGLFGHQTAEKVCFVINFSFQLLWSILLNFFYSYA